MDILITSVFTSAVLSLLLNWQEIVAAARYVAALIEEEKSR